VDAQNPSSATRPFSLSIYLIIVFGVSWPFQLVPLVWGSEWMIVIAGSFVSMIMVGVGTYVAAKYVFKDGLAGAGWTFGRLRHHLVVILLALGLWCVPILVDIALGTRARPDLLELNRLGVTFLVVFPLLIVVSFCQEFSWRGYLLPRLARRWPAGKAVVVQAIAWCMWQLPLMVVPMIILGRELARVSGLPLSFTMPWVFAVGVVSGVLHGVVFAYFWSVSASLAVVTLYHALYDGLRDSTWLTIDHGLISQWWAMIGVSLLGVWFLWKDNWPGLRTDVGRHVEDGSEPALDPPGPSQSQ